jgi:MoaA/NifB/PqqE/SkfB family radical SAM enzyme
MDKILAIDAKVGVRVSLDGLGNTHDYIRGVRGMYEHALATTDRLKKLGVDNIGFSFTVMSGNACELKDVYSLSKERGYELAIALVQNSEIYFSKKDNTINEPACVRSGLGFVIENELKTWQPKRWLRSYYDYGLLYYAQKGKRLLPSGAGLDSAFIDADGTLYPSNLINMPMGNLKDTSLDNLWQNRQAVEARNVIKREGIQESWIICTIRGEIKRNWLRVGSWVAKGKLKVMFGRPVI